MRSLRRVLATLEEVTLAPQPGTDGGTGITLGFRPQRCRLDVDHIDDVIPLGPGLTVAVALGLAKLVRVLRAARIAPPSEPADLVDHPEEARALLVRAIGALVELEIRARSSIRFTVWTDQGVETVSDVLEVTEDAQAYWVRRRAGQFPVQFERSQVIRQKTECENWWEITEIDRPS